METVEQKIGRREAYRRKYVFDYPGKWLQRDEVDAVFLLGTGKCGTTTVQNILNLSEAVVAYHEPPPRLWHLGQRVWDSPPGLDTFWGEILWSSRRDLMSTIQAHGMIYAECNHRLSNWAHIIAKEFPKAKFLLVWRDFEETVVSGVRWGWYGIHDRNIEGRITPPKHLNIGDVRKAVAWYWINLHRYLLEQLEQMDPSRYKVMPFTTIKDHHVGKWQHVFAWLGCDMPTGDEIEHVLDQKINASQKSLEVEKNWQEFDEEAANIQRRLINVGD